MHYILTLANRPEGVFSVIDDEGERVIPIWESEDDVRRYHTMMGIEEEDNPSLQIVEIDKEIIVTACEERYHKYAIITTDDFLIPPKDLE